MFPKPHQVVAASIVAVAGAAALSGCASRPMSTAQLSARHQPVIYARAGTQAWTLRNGALSVRVGGSWLRMKPPVTPSPGDGVAVKGPLQVVAHLHDGRVQVAVSHDRGRTWQTDAAILHVDANSVAVDISKDSRNWLIGPSGGPGAGSLSRYSEAFISNADGTLSRIQTPGSAADLAWLGSNLLVPGGPDNSRLYLSKDLGLTWLDVTADVLGFAAPNSDIPPTEPIFGGVIGLADGSVLVSVTTTSDDGSAVDVKVERTIAGTDYTEIAATSVAGDFAGPTALSAVSPYGSGSVAIVLPGTMTLYTVDGQGEYNKIQMSNLPVSPDSISFQDATNGIAEVTIASCNGAKKDDCTSEVANYTTSDGGQTWMPA